MSEFAGKIILVTGATSGIGRATSVALAESGAIVIAAGRRRDLGVQLEAEATGCRGSISFSTLDVSDETSIDSLFAHIETQFGRLDGALNNAGTESESLPVPDMPVADFDRLFSVNVRGTWLCMRHEMRFMRAQGSGAIVNTSSVAGVKGYPGASAYSASKHAIVGMTRAAGLEFPDRGVRVNCFCPGATRSEMSARWSERLPNGYDDLAQLIPIKRVSEPREQAEVAMFLLSDRSSYVTGAVYTCDGGSSAG